MSNSIRSSTYEQTVIVIGASMAGLLAARVLSQYFEQVLVVERDPHKDDLAPRKGVGQGNHAHILLKSGEETLEKLFPGIVADLIQKGAFQLDFSADVKWFHFGSWKIQYKSDFRILVQTRPLLEQTVRSYVGAIKNVIFYNGYSAEDLLTSSDRKRVVGLRIQNQDDASETENLIADLVVDASGRGSRLPQWLEKLNYKRPQETTVKIDLMYSSRLYAMPTEIPKDWKLMAFNPLVGQTMRAGYIFPVENNRWLVTLAGYSGDRSPETNDTFLDYAKGLATPDLYNAIKNLEPISDVKTFRVPAAIRHHYETLSNMPQGLIVMGDAFCAFDPIFGQGMSVAAKEALKLDKLLSNQGYDADSDFPRRFHKQIASVLMDAWLLSTSEDFRYPKTEGKKPFFLPILHWYSGHVFRLSATDREVHSAFRDVLHLTHGALRLFQPAILKKVIIHALVPQKQNAKRQVTVEGTRV